MWKYFCAAILLIVISVSVTLLCIKIIGQKTTGTDIPNSGAIRIQAIREARKIGLGQCTAGDEHGCIYYEDKLRDLSDPDGAEYLKACLISAKFFASDPALYQIPPQFQRNDVNRYDLKCSADLAEAKGDSSSTGALRYLAHHQDTNSFLAGGTIIDLGEPQKN